MIPFPEAFMAARKSTPLYIGIGSHVVALNASTGEEIWRTKVKSTSYITILIDGPHIYAGASGELFCLKASSGELVWHNKLKGLGHSLIAFAGSDAAQVAAMRAAQAAATTAAVVAAT
ncbi:MAG: PQQ-binding-like beta-propeller repeat protein [Gemmatimonadaceae bacterium]|nr:PQQ-binding-like beta-propeller repeat protein [Gemmatimonadaceae bacterium]